MSTSATASGDDCYNLVLYINRDVRQRSAPRCHSLQPVPPLVVSPSISSSSSPNIRTSSTSGRARDQDDTNSGSRQRQHPSASLNLYARETANDELNREVNNLYFGLSANSGSMTRAKKNNDNNNSNQNNSNSNAMMTGVDLVQNTTSIYDPQQQANTTSSSSPSRQSSARRERVIAGENENSSSNVENSNSFLTTAATSFVEKAYHRQRMADVAKLSPTKAKQAANLDRQFTSYNMPRRVDEFRAWHARRQKLRPSREEVELEQQLRSLADRRRRRTVMMNRMERDRLASEEDDALERKRRKQEAEDEAHRRAIASGVYFLGKDRIVQEREKEKEDKEVGADRLNNEFVASASPTPQNKPRSITLDDSSSPSSTSSSLTPSSSSRLTTRKKNTFDGFSFNVKARIFEFLPVIPSYMFDDIRFICTFLPTDDAMTLYQPQIARAAFDFVEQCLQEHKDQFAQASTTAIVIGLSDECLQDAWRHEVGAAGSSSAARPAPAAAAAPSSSSSSSTFFTSATLAANNHLAKRKQQQEQQHAAAERKLARKRARQARRRNKTKGSNGGGDDDGDDDDGNREKGERDGDVSTSSGNNNKRPGQSSTSQAISPLNSPYHCSVPHHQRELYGQMIAIATSELLRQRQILNLCEKWVSFERTAIETRCSVLRLVLRECLASWTKRVIVNNNFDHNNNDNDDDAGVGSGYEGGRKNKNKIDEDDDDDDDQDDTSSSSSSSSSSASDEAIEKEGKNRNTQQQQKQQKQDHFHQLFIKRARRQIPKRNSPLAIPYFPQDINPSVRELLRANIESMTRRVKAVEFVGAPTTEAEDIRDMMWDARSTHLPEGATREYGRTLTLGQIVSLGIADVPWVRGFAWQDRTSCVVSRQEIDITKMMAQFPELEAMRELSLELVVDTQKVIEAREAEQRRLELEKKATAEHERKMRVKKTATDALARRVWKPLPKSSVVSQKLHNQVLLSHHPFGSCEICGSIHIHQVGLKKMGSAVIGDVAVCEDCYEEAYESIPTIHKLYDWVAVRDVVDYDEKTRTNRTTISEEVDDEGEAENEE